MIVLVLGGTRSGKSEHGEALALRLAEGAPVTYVATGTVTDDDHRRRVDAHRQRRPDHWVTRECGDTDLAATLGALDGVVLLDSLGAWVANHLDSPIDGAALIAELVARPSATVIVSDEVGWSVHPPTEVGRRFVDELGTLNQAVAAVADVVHLVVAGRVLALPATAPDPRGNAGC